MIRFPRAALTLLTAAVPASAVRAQALASPFGTVSQKVDSTTMTVEYYRPSLRGRTVFGRQVHWGELWTPGANWATTLEVDHDIRLEGQPLPRGKYSMWMIPAARPEPWVVVLSRDARRFHMMRPDPKDDQLRITVAPDSGARVEVLTFDFPEVTREGATLQLRWAETTLALRFLVESSRAAATAAHPLASYAGMYELRDDANAAPVRYEIIERGGGLWVRTTADAVEAGLDPEFDLLPAGGDSFHPRQYKNGKVVGVELDETLVFHLEGSRATGFDLRGTAEAKILARATRSRP